MAETSVVGLRRRMHLRVELVAKRPLSYNSRYSALYTDTWVSS